MIRDFATKDVEKIIIKRQCRSSDRYEIRIWQDMTLIMTTMAADDEDDRRYWVSLNKSE